MKALVKFLVIAAVCFASPAMAAPGSSDSVKVLSTKRYILYFKVDKKLIGGKVEVWNDKNELVQSDDITRAKTIVDFFFLTPGSYTVKVKKGEATYSVEYYNFE